MKQCIVCEYIGYTDYHSKSFRPQNIPNLNSESQSPDYGAFVKGISDDWQSQSLPFSKTKSSDNQFSTRNQNTHPLLENENNLVVPEDQKQNLKMNCIALIDVDKAEEGTAEKLELKQPQIDDDKSEKTGIINRVKNKFLSIFSSHSSSNKSDDSDRNPIDEKSKFKQWQNDQDGLEYFDNNDFLKRKVSERSTDSRTPIQNDLLKNLSDTDLIYIKNFIKCFKENKNEFKVVTNNVNEVIDGISTGTSKTPVLQTTLTTTTENCGSQTTKTSIAETVTSSTLSNDRLNTFNTTNDEADTITVDLDIDQKNGSGEEYQPVDKSNTSQRLCSETKYFTKAKAMAHLPHVVDKCLVHKPLDLSSHQNVDFNHNKPTVLMGDRNTTECVPLRLNDMNFDLEWNKNNKHSEKINNLNNILLSKQEQSSNDASLNTQKFEDQLITSYDEHNLPSLQNFQDESHEPLKVSKKRELPFKSFRKQKASNNYAFVPDTASVVNCDYEMPPKANIKRRTRFRGKSRSRTKPKHKSRHKSPSRSRKSNLESIRDKLNEKTNSYKSFHELSDIQFRVSPDDEEAITKFISNLNSPPELFSFDVDKYLGSTNNDIKVEEPNAKARVDNHKFPVTSEKGGLPLWQMSVEEGEKPLFEEHKINEKKRDLLRQYIKGFSKARLLNRPEKCVKASEDKSQRSSINTNIPSRVEDFDSGYMQSEDLKSDNENSNQDDEFLNNFYLLNDGSAQILNLERQYPDVVESSKIHKINKDFGKQFNDFD